MKIKKTYQGVVPTGKVLNAQSNSQNDTYSCDYLNKIVVISDTEPQNNAQIWIKPLSRNLINTNTMLYKKDTYSPYETGQIMTLKNYNTLKVKVSPNTSYNISGYAISNLCFFTTEMVFISGLSFDSGGTFTTPENCSYIIFTAHNSYQNLQLEKGTSATAYVPYQEPSVKRLVNGTYIDIFTL